MRTDTEQAPNGRHTGPQACGKTLAAGPKPPNSSPSQEAPVTQSCAHAATTGTPTSLTHSWAWSRMGKRRLQGWEAALLLIKDQIICRDSLPLLGHVTKSRALS